MRTPALSRRRLLAAGAAALAAPLLSAVPAWAAPRRCPMGAAPRGGPRPAPHPTPRPGVTGAKVLSRDELSGAPELAPLFDAVRAMPAVVDGIRCHCGCATQAGYYSLLSCYEAPAMALVCPICQGQGRVAARLHRAGKSLDEIRAAVDAQFG